MVNLKCPEDFQLLATLGSMVVYQHKDSLTCDGTLCVWRGTPMKYLKDLEFSVTLGKAPFKSITIGYLMDSYDSQCAIVEELTKEGWTVTLENLSERFAELEEA
jgi:hypothetical protein